MKKSIIVPFAITIVTLHAIDLAPITVESSKLEDSRLESTSSITMINKEKLELSDTKSIEELSSLVSNTNISGVGNRHNKTITMRGISNYVTYESSVAVYIDDVPVPFSYGFGMLDMSNVKSVEVLKGAQGTLFGKGAQSGVINIYTKTPTKTFSNEVSASYSSYNTNKFHAVVAGPTSNEDLTYSFAITKETSDGYARNKLTQSNFDYQDFVSFSGKLRYNPSTPLDISLNYTKSKSDDGGSPFTINIKQNPFSIDNEPFNDYVKMDTDMLSLIVKYKENDYTFTSATSYAKESVLSDNYIGILGGLFIGTDIDIQEVTQEFRLKQDFDNSELLVGAFYSDKLQFDYKENQKLLVPNLNSLNSLENPDKNLALFTQYKYYLGEHFSLMAGVRYEETKRSFARNLNNFGAPSTYANANTTWTHILPTISLSYLGDDDSNTYFTYSKGYRSGGYNYRSTNSLVPFEPEKTDSFELGYKKIYGKTFTLDSALFYNMITDHRINTFDDNLASTTLNASKADTYGLELELNYKNDALFLYATLGVTQAKIKEFNKTSMYDNKKLIDVPDMTAALGVQYKLNKKLYVKSDLRYMGERYYNIDNTAKEGSYTITDLSFCYKKENWELELFANNIFDKRYVDFMIYTPSNNYYHFGAPRVVGVKLSGSF